jgi:alanyl-tRNA synthetase
LIASSLDIISALTAAVDIDGVKVLAVKLDGVEPKAMIDVLDQLKNKLISAAIVLATLKRHLFH